MTLQTLLGTWGGEDRASTGKLKTRPCVLRRERSDLIWVFCLDDDTPATRKQLPIVRRVATAFEQTDMTDDYAVFNAVDDHLTARDLAMRGFSCRWTSKEKGPVQ